MSDNDDSKNELTDGIHQYMCSWGIDMDVSHKYKKEFDAHIGFDELDIADYVRIHYSDYFVDIGVAIGCLLFNVVP